MEDNKSTHTAIADPQPYRGSGKEVGQVSPPIVSMSPVSSDDKAKGEADKPLVIDNAIDYLIKANGGGSQFGDLEVGQGMFFPNPKNKTTDQHVEDLQRKVYNAKVQFSEIERDENGDEVLESLVIKTRKRNDDGTLQLQNGQPIVGANQTNKPKYVGYRNFVVKGVAKDTDVSGSKISEDGVLVIRVS